MANQQVYMNPEDFGWANANDVLVPKLCLNPIPPELLVICQCGGKCDTMKCICKLNGFTSVLFCHKKRESWIYVATHNLTMVLFCFESKLIDALLSNVVIVLHLLKYILLV